MSKTDDDAVRSARPDELEISASKRAGALGRAVERAYEDISPAVGELGGLCADVLALVRKPFQLVREKAERLIENAANKVPGKRRIQPTLALAGPIIENSQYHEPGTPLYEMFSNLLARAMDSERVDEAHPAFAHVIAQLSPDEAKMLYQLRKEPIRLTDKYELCDLDPNTELQEDERPRYRKIHDGMWEGFQYWSKYEVEVTHRQHLPMYTEHLIRLNLIYKWDSWESKSEYIKGSHELARETMFHELRLSKFGALFVRACVPEEPAKEWDW